MGTIRRAGVAARAARGLAPAVLMAGLAWLGPARPAAALPPGSPQSVAAVELCDAVDEMPEADRDAALERGLAMAEAAIAADARDARGHFAQFCLLGKRMDRSGLSWRQVFDLRRLTRAIDATLALAPGDADALAGKGALLLKLPRLLGGDPAEAEALLRRALVAEPDNGAARCYLAEALRARGRDASEAGRPDC